jgi:hypothetical protein
MMSPKKIRESRGWLALGLVLVFFLATLIVCLLHAAGHSALGTVQIVYGGASALAVTMVLLFGVGSWSRFLPVNEMETGADPGTPPNLPAQQTPPEGGQGHDPTS